MRRYHFDLIDSNSVTDASGALLDNDAQACQVARGLARQVRQTRPELVGHGYEVRVRAESGEDVWSTTIDPSANERDGGA